MTVKEYLENLGPHYDVTFIKARARKDARTPYYHPEYQTTPIWRSNDWLKPNNKPILDSIVMNDKQPSITWLSGVDLNIRIKDGSLKCLLIITPEDLELLTPGKQQRDHMIQYIDERLDIRKEG